MEVKKFTDGCVEQTFEDGKCVRQRFIAIDGVSYEDRFGDVLPPEKVEAFQKSGAYQTFDMLQPDTEIIVAAQDVSVWPAHCKPGNKKDSEDVPDSESRVDIEIIVSGGLITSVDIPTHLENVVVVVKDYDTDGFSEGIEKDEDGEFVSSEWTP